MRVGKFFWRFLKRNEYSPYNINQSYAEAVVRRCSVEKVFLEISQNSQENTCARVSFLIKLLQLYLKKDSGTVVFL